MTKDDTTEEELPLLPKKLELNLDKPYGGLFGNTVIASVVEEVVADPHSLYRPKDLVELLDVSLPAISKALNTLTQLKLLEKDTSDRQHPVYRVNTRSKKFIALTFLAYGVLDDRDGSLFMDSAIEEYCESVIGEKSEPYVIVAENDNIMEIYDAVDKIYGALGRITSVASTASIVVHEDSDDTHLVASV